MILWQYDIYKCHMFFGVLLPTKDFLEKLQEQTKRLNSKEAIWCAHCIRTNSDPQVLKLPLVWRKTTNFQLDLFWLWEEVVSLEPMNQNLPFNDLMLKVGKIHISVALNRTSNCRRTNFTFDTSFHNKSGYKQKNVKPQKRQCSSSWLSLAGAGSLLDGSSWFTLNPNSLLDGSSWFTLNPNSQNPSIDRTWQCLQLTGIIPALLTGFKSCIIATCHKGTKLCVHRASKLHFYFLYSWPNVTIAELF